VREPADEIQLDVVQQASLAKTLGEVFETAADGVQDGSWLVSHVDMFEGLAVLELYRRRDCQQISDLLDELHLTKDGDR
jgi:hypothetical protein